MTREKLQQIGKSQGVRQAALMMVGNTGAQGLSAVALLILSRILGPSDFGEFSVGFALVLLLAKINDLGMTYVLQRYIPQAKSVAERVSLYQYTTRLKLKIGVIILLVGLIVGGRLAQILNFENTLIIYLAFGVSLATVGFEHVGATLQAWHRFSQSVIANSLQAGMKLASVVGLWMTGLLNPLNAFLGYGLAPFLPVILAKKLLPRELWQKNHELKIEKEKVFRMAGHSAVALVTAGIIENIDVLMVQRYLSEYETGLYSGVNRIAMLFMMLAYSLGQVLNPRVSRYIDQKNMKPFLKKAGLLVLGCGVGYLVTVPFMDLLIRLSIGQDYLAASGALNMLMMASFVTIATIPFMATFFAFPKAEWYFSMSGVLQLIIIVGLNALLVPSYGLDGAAWARLGSRIVLFGFTATLVAWMYRKHYGEGNEEKYQK